MSSLDLKQSHLATEFGLLQVLFCFVKAGQFSALWHEYVPLEL